MNGDGLNIHSPKSSDLRSGRNDAWNLGCIQRLALVVVAGIWGLESWRGNDFMIMALPLGSLVAVAIVLWLSLSLARELIINKTAKVFDEPPKPSSNYGMDDLISALEPIACASNLEVGRSAAELVRLANELELQSHEIESGSSNAESAVTQATEGVHQVVSAIAEVETTIDEMINGVRLASDLAQNTAKSSKDSLTLAGALQSQTKEVESIITAIEDIAKKTNLLALNATIESVRAGSAGKGFAVVADEVKGLARQTASLVECARSQIGNIRGTIDQTVEKVSDLADRAQMSGEAVSKMSAALEEQGTIVDEVNRSASQAAQGAQSSCNATQSVLSVLAESKPMIETVCERVNSIQLFLASVSGDLVELLRNADPNHKRAFRRYELQLPCKIRHGKTHTGAEIINLSYGGVALANVGGVVEGEIVLEIEGIDFVSHVVGMSDSGKAHVNFAELLPSQAEHLSQLIRRSTPEQAAA